MRVSSYITGAPVPETETYALLHGYRGDLQFVSIQTGMFLLKHMGKEPPLSRVSDEEIAVLKGAGFLTDMSVSEERDLVIEMSKALRQRNFGTNPTAFMIVPSVTCNLRCPYCFQSHEMHKGKGVFGNLMTTEQLDVIFDTIDRLAAPGAVRADALGLPIVEHEFPISEKMITLFGGEPLCKATLSIIPDIVRRCQERGITLSAITNGVELELFNDFLNDNAINHLQVTLDGLAEKHDRRRIGPEHKKTFDKIVENVGRALVNGIAVSMRINVDTENLLNIQELNSYFREIGWNKYPHFQPYAAAVDALSPKQQTKRVTHYEVYAETERLKDEEQSRITSYENFAEELVSSILLRPDEFHLGRGSTCAAETGQLIFDPLGDVYSCWEDVGIKKLRVATYSKKGLTYEVDAIQEWLHRFPGAVEQCSSCPFALIHTSGCGAHAREEQGDLHSSACEGFQELFPPSLGKAVHKFNKRFQTSLRKSQNA